MIIIFECIIIMLQLHAHMSSMCMCVYVCVCMYVCVCVYMHVYVHVCVYVCMYVCMWWWGDVFRQNGARWYVNCGAWTRAHFV